MRKVQILLLVALLIFNAAAAAYADVTITLNGTLDPLVLDVSVPVTSLTYHLPSGEAESEIRTITIENNTDAPVNMKIAGMTVDTNVWNVQMVTPPGDNHATGYGADWYTRNKRAAFLLIPEQTGGWETNPDGRPTGEKFCPSDNPQGAANLVNWRKSVNSDWGNVGDYFTAPFLLGTIAPLSSVTVYSKLCADPRRVAKNWAGTLTLAFELKQP